MPILFCKNQIIITIYCNYCNCFIERNHIEIFDFLPIWQFNIISSNLDPVIINQIFRTLDNPFIHQFFLNPCQTGLSYIPCPLHHPNTYHTG